MDWINELLPQAYLYAIGWMLIHAIWQVAGIGLVLWFLLRYSSQRTSTYKYNLGISSLVLMLVVSICTFGYYFELDTQSADHSIEEFSQYITTVNSDFKGELVDIRNEDSASSQWLGSLFELIDRNIPVLVNVWMIGVALFMIKFASAMADLKTLRSRPTSAIAPKWEKTLDQYVKKLKIDRTIRIFESKFISTPLTFGILKPIILIPTGLIFQLSSVQVEAIIAHELAHIKRHDFLVNILQSMMEMVFFFHPVFWWINGVIRTERENVCDDIAVQLGVAPRALAEALVTCTNYSIEASPQLTLAATSRNTPTLDRIKRIMGFSSPHKPTSTLTSLTMSLSLILTTSIILGAQAYKSSVNDIDQFLTNVQSEIILADNYWLQLETTTKVDQISDKLKQDFGNLQKESNESKIYFEKVLPKLSEKSSRTKSYDLKISLSEDGKAFSFEDLSEANKSKLFAEFENYKISGDTLHVWSNTKEEEIKMNLLNNEAIAPNLKIAPLEFLGHDFSKMPIKKLDQSMVIPGVKFDAQIDTTKSTSRVQGISVNLNKNTFEPSVRSVAGNPSVNVSANTAPTTSVRGTTLTQEVFEQNYARALATSPSKAAKGSELDRVTGVSTARGNYKIDTTKSYNKELKEATNKLSNAKTEEERNVAIQRITEISEKIASSASQQWVKNDSVIAEFSRRSAEAIGPWMEENSKQMEEWQLKLEPLMKSFNEKMEGLNEKLLPLNDEFQANFKKFDEESRPILEEYQRKIAEWQKENQPKMEEFQKKMAEWQIEYATKMKELQKEFKEKKNSPDK
ncbi:M48 family metalloprotease [Belliella sp. DSM 111904]|uniref:M48 family metalloprotease n=1 Tax=Belliella filtrata TaxID=2923435 RepID=A0ABS9UX44_9BACT|nr:M56 family metallopeptidase [Belliella filtrata]MCH7408751.1 M48 family metalloprotease [Belliella filtrata]